MVNKRILYSIYKGVFGDSLPDPTKDIECRIRLQKIAFFAQEALGIPIGATFSLYIHGPYSPDIAKVYYEEGFLENVRRARELEKPRKIEILRSLASRAVVWLEIASTYFSFKRKGLDSREAILRTAEIKNVPIDKVNDIAQELDELLI